MWRSLRQRSIQRQLLLFVALGTPLVWLAALGVSLYGGNKEINELFDTQQVRFAELVSSVLATDGNVVPSAGPRERGTAHLKDAAELEDFAVAVWNQSGALRFSEQNGVDLPFRPGFSGFADLSLGDAWRVYYLNVPDADAIVAVGQRSYERAELLGDILLAQLLPWMAMLVLLVAVLSIGIRQALAPAVALARDIEVRPSGDLRAIPTRELPNELVPLVGAINRLFGRISEAIEHERRFTADAAHELRTPLAATRAQWEVMERTKDPEQRAAASRHVTSGLMRMSGLVTQLLALARLDAVEAASFERQIDWEVLIEQAVRESLPLANERAIEFAIEWPVRRPLPLMGNPELIVSALRNLIDNAVRYAPVGSTITIVCDTDHISVHDEGPGVPDSVLPKLGQRFFRHAGQQTVGSGLGLSIVRRIAHLHSLRLHLSNREGGGFTASLGRGTSTPVALAPGSERAAA